MESWLQSEVITLKETRISNDIIIFAGTTEGRTLSEYLAAAGIAHTICVATEYGELALKEHPLVTVHRGRMDEEAMREYLKQKAFAAVVDATHPYATAVTANIRAAVKDLTIPYLRLKREILEEEETGVCYFESNEACAKVLEQTKGNILLTTGSKELSVYASSEKIKNRLYVRVLPGLESLHICMEQGISGKQIIALQGPFSEEMNTAILHQYQIQCMVTKKSGRAGGYEEKIKAAKKAGIPVYVIGQKKTETGDTFTEVCKKLEVICGCKILPQQSKNRFEIILVGVGMGSRESLTNEVEQAIRQADILLGAKRMIASYQPKLEKKPYYRTEQIIPYLEEMQKDVEVSEIVTGQKVVVLFSGDSGFYSGAASMYRALQEEISAERLQASVRILSGISSVAYLAACIGESYQDAAVYSMHGKELLNLAERIRNSEKTFLLMSGVSDVQRLGEILDRAGLESCRIYAGYQLSYPEQEILELTPKECLALQKEGLYTCFIKNPSAAGKRLTHGRADTEFLRDRVPMTKEEVRDVSICKLKLHKGAVFYDIGSGTGSIAVEAAGLSNDIRVFAIEKKEEAAALIGKNKEHFGLENIEIIKADAPDGLETLLKPTHAFIGGSSRRMNEILSVLYQKNPKMRIVINAISLETICEIKEVLSDYPIENEELIQLQVSRARVAGSYHLMQAENPVWICAFDFCG